MSRLKFWVAALLLSLVVRSALAQEADVGGQAEEAFVLGHALLNDKRYAEACAKFQQSQTLDPAAGTLLALAYCQELSGLLASARTSYVAAAELAQRAGQADRQAAAIERAQALTPRVSKLTVVVSQELLIMPGFHVLRDGLEFERASFGIAIPMDGGSHAFSAFAPGRAAWTSTVTLNTEGDQKTLVLPILDLADPLPSAPLAPPPSAGAPGTAAPPADSGLALRRASLAFAAGGLVSLGLGTAFALSAKSKKDESNSDGHCDASGCDERGVQLRNEALSSARASTWTSLAGGALAACSVTLFLESNRVASDPKTGAGSHSEIRASVSGGESRIFLMGSF